MWLLWDFFKKVPILCTWRKFFSVCDANFKTIFFWILHLCGPCSSSTHRFFNRLGIWKKFSNKFFLLVLSLLYLIKIYNFWAKKYFSVCDKIVKNHISFPKSGFLMANISLYVTQLCKPFFSENCISVGHVLLLPIGTLTA